MASMETSARVIGPKYTAVEPTALGNDLPKTNLKISHAEFLQHYAPTLKTHMIETLKDPKNYTFHHRDLFSAFYKIACSSLMAPAIHCLAEVMNEFFAQVKMQLAACEISVLIGALIQFNQHYAMAEKVLQPPLRPIETLPSSSFPFSTANWFKTMRADHLFRNPILQNNIAAALRLITIESLQNYEHEHIRALIIMLWDAERQYADCNPELFRKFVPALNARRPIYIDPTPPPDPRTTYAWAVAEAKRLGIHEGDDFGITPANNQGTDIQNRGADDGMDIDDGDDDDDDNGDGRRRKRRKRERMTVADDEPA